MSKHEYEEFKKELANLATSNRKPTLLLHSCCGPCSSHVLNLLSQYFKITVYYYNPNIYPLEEFEKRLNTQKELLSKLDYNVDLIVEKDDYSVYLKNVDEYKHLGEKSMRCYKCYEFRMIKLQLAARHYNFDYFTTTLSVSPHKNSLWINEIGSRLTSDKCKYLYSDFKKENGYLDSTNLAKNMNYIDKIIVDVISHLKKLLKEKKKKNEK